MPAARLANNMAEYPSAFAVRGSRNRYVSVGSKRHEPHLVHNRSAANEQCGCACPFHVGSKNFGTIQLIRDQTPAERKNLCGSWARTYKSSSTVCKYAASVH